MRKTKWLVLLLAMLTVCCLCPLTVAAEEIVVVPAYNIWVGSVEVTPDNADSVTGEGITFGEGGYIRYDAETRTLTLCNANIEGYHTYEDDWNPDNIIAVGLDAPYASVKQLVLLGDNSISVNVGGTEDAGAIVYGLIAHTITGGGSLDISVDGSTYNMQGIESTRLTVRNADLTIRVGCEETDTKCLNGIGMRTPNGMTYEGGKLNITVGDVQNSTTGIDSMMDVTMTDVDAIIRVGTGRFSRDPIFVMAHPMDDFVSGLTMNGGSLKAYSDKNIARVGYLDLGEDAWYQYAINTDDMTEVYDYTDASEAPMTPELLYSAKYIHIADASLEIVDPNAKPEPAPTPVPEEEDEVIVERMTESVSNAVASGVELVISAIADNAVSEKAAAVLVPVVKDVVGVAVEQLGEVVDLVEVSKTINRVHKMFTSLTKLIMELN